MSSYKTILFIEDEAFISELYSEVLRKHGFEVTCAPDGQQGLDLAQNIAYDLILLDIMLPVIPGTQVLTTLRDPATTPNSNQATPIFILTNFEEDDATKQQLLSQAQAYLVKVDITPLTLTKLLQSPPADSSPLPTNPN